MLTTCCNNAGFISSRISCWCRSRRWRDTRADRTDRSGDVLQPGGEAGGGETAGAEAVALPGLTRWCVHTAVPAVRGHLRPAPRHAHQLVLHPAHRLAGAAVHHVLQQSGYHRLLPCSCLTVGSTVAAPARCGVATRPGPSSQDSSSNIILATCRLLYFDSEICVHIEIRIKPKMAKY